jgi:hypothetical protein
MTNLENLLSAIGVIKERVDLKQLLIAHIY